jgi:steroid delta-isomerase-like uncharacterized protein
MATTGDPATIERNKLIGRRVLLEAWGEGRLEVIDELYASDYVDNVSRGPEPTTVRGPAGLKAAVTLFRTAFPDLRYEVDEQVAENDVVVTRFSAAGTHMKPFLGVAPTEQRIVYSGIDVNRVRDGRIAESWVQYDALGLLQQLGIVPPVDAI